MIRKSLVYRKKQMILVFFLLFSLHTLKAQKASEILWDNYGVPHVYAKNEKEMYFAFGWAQMQNHSNLLLKLYAQARGKAAAYFGEEFVESDKQIQLFNLPDSAKTHYAKLTGVDKQYLDAFVDGVNSYAKSNPNKIDEKSKQVLPVLATDVLAHYTRVMCLEFLAKGDITNTKRLITPGSNSYAIAPSKSTSKNSMLVANPHLQWSDFYTFFEAQLSAPGFEVYGVSLIGIPNILIGFNKSLGWTHTVNTIDASDRYELTLKEGGYILDGKKEEFELKTIALKVLQKDGSEKEQPFTLKYSKHGPVIGEKNDKAYAIRIAGLENALFAKQYHDMGKAKNLNEFETALKMLQNPMFNVIYADKDGNILYLFNGDVPKRTEGDWTFWNGTIDGTKSKYIWNQYHSYKELPRLLNPKTGFLQNANDPPWTSTYPTLLTPENYPSYMSPKNMSLRPQRAVNMIKDDASITFNELVAYKMNSGLEAADRFLDDLIAAVNQYPDTIAIRASNVLEKWDKATEIDSKGAVLFMQWFDKLNETMFAIPWNFEHPVTTPDGLADPKKAVELLVQAATEIEKIYGSIDVAWGDVNRFKVGKYDFPANGGSGRFGIFRTMAFQQNKQNNKNYAYHGDSYVAIIEFGKKVKAQVLLSYGNSSNPDSKHFGDQLQLLSEKKLRTALLTRKDILKNLEKKEILNINDDK